MVQEQAGPINGHWTVTPRATEFLRSKGLIIRAAMDRSNVLYTV